MDVDAATAADADADASVVVLSSLSSTCTLTKGTIDTIDCFPRLQMQIYVGLAPILSSPGQWILQFKCNDCTNRFISLAKKNPLIFLHRQRVSFFFSPEEEKYAQASLHQIYLVCMSWRIDFFSGRCLKYEMPERCGNSAVTESL